MTLPKVWSRDLKDPEQREQRLARLEDMENEIFHRAAGVLNAVMSFHEVTPHQQEPPPEWVEEFGPEGAKQRLAVAKTGWLPQSLAPNATKLATQVATGILRARGHRAAKVNNTFNATINLPPPATRQAPGPEVYPVKEIE